MKKLAFLILIVPLIFCTPLKAHELKKSFEEGLAAYQKQNFKKALSAFQAVIEKDPYNYVALYNLGLTQYQLKQEGIALANWRRAIGISPLFIPARKALEHVLKTKEVFPPLSNSLWEMLHLSFFIYFPLDFFWGGLLVALLLSLWMLIKFLGKKKKHLKDNLPPPSFPVSVTISLCVTVVFLLAFGFKIWDLAHPRGTITAKQVALHSAPDKQSSTLIEVSLGQEVFVEKQSGPWRQVLVSSGISGWIPSSSVTLTYGFQLW
ncbi:MAG: hypothetical protein D6797_07785 [Bdellovibrio sp.]|nr:MAG: hypothetical protein D6797_07785 [Bdellovibrio sp.]